MVFFDPRNIERESENILLPAGEYVVSVDRCSKKDSMNGVGCFVFFRVVTPESHKNSQVMSFFNLEHNSEAAQKIGRLEFTRLLDTIDLGQTVIQDPSELCGRSLMIEVETVTNYKDPSKLQNKVKKFLPLSLADKDRAEEAFKKLVPADIPF